MSKPTWIATVAFGLAIFVAVSGIGVYVSVDLLHDYQDSHKEQRDKAAYADRSAIEKYFDCTDRGGIPLECAIHSVTSDGEQERAKYDLNAQQDMAEWAFALLLATIASIALSVLGLVAIVWSLALNRTATEAAVGAAEQSQRANDLAEESNRVSRENAEADRRPWMQVAFGLPNGVKLEKDGIRVDVVPVVRNIGKSVAYDVWVEAHAVLPGEGVIGNITTQFCTKWINVSNQRNGPSGPAVNGKVLFPDEHDSPGTFPTIIKGEALHGIKIDDPDSVVMPHIFVICTYRKTASTKELSVTAKSFLINRTEDGSPRFIHVRDLDIASEDVGFSDSMQPNHVT